MSNGALMIRFHALGGLTVTVEGDEVPLGGARQRRLLAVLLIHRNAVVSADRLADAVFAGRPTPAAGATLRSYVARMRRVLEGAGSGSLLVTRAPGYLLRLPDEAFDAARFEQLVAAAGSQLARQDAAGASSHLREALDLWRGDAYAEFADEDWARPEVQRLAELRLVAQERLFEAELVCRRAAEVIPELEALTDEHPLREAFRAQLMVALYRVGRQAEALRVYRDYRDLLVEELGVDPTPGLAALERRVLNHDPALTPDEPAGLPLRGYLLAERLGTGRDGTVYTARLPGVDRDFVVRIIRKEIADHPEFVRSFEASAQLVASLRHPAIVPIHDYWREPGAAYLVSRRMPGGSLADLLSRGLPPVREVATLVARVGGALVAAAERGIVHGRVIPESVLFDDAGAPYLGDFAVGPPGSSSSLGDDVSDLALLVRACVGHDRGPLGEVLAVAGGTAGRPAMTELVPALVEALTGAEPAAGRALPNPYKGLRAFDESDADDFFGRKELVDLLVARLRGDDLRGRLVLLVGGSGTGKSSVVRAGLLPRIRRGDAPGSERWFVTTMLPGSAPFKELAECLRRVAVDETPGLAERLAEDETAVDRVLRGLVPGDGQLLLVVDQLEELFTLASPPDQRALLDGLTYAVSAPDSRLRVVATLRADFYDRPLAFHTLGPFVGDATVPMVPMSPSDLEAAVVEPLARVGGRVDEALVTELVRAVVDQSAALPSLQYTLYELAEREPGKHLGLDGYRKLGGVDGAIASRAERLFSSLDERERALVRGLFERLVVVATEGEPTRRRAARTELLGLGDDPTVDSVIDRWAAARLLTLDRHPRSRVPTVELAHEAMIREWPRLRGWIEVDRESILALGRIRDAAAAWVDLGRHPDALYRGARLEMALELHGRPADLPEPERGFLEASREARDREAQEESERSARQVRDIRRLRVQRIAIVLALAVAVVGGLIAVDQRQQAEQERRIASARELAAIAETSLTEDPDRSILLAMAAVERTRAYGEPVLPEAEQALHRAVAGSRLLLSVPDIGGSVAWSPTGDVFVTEGPEESGVVDIRDATTGESIRSFRGHEDDVNDVTFSADGSMIATSGDDGAVRVWDTATGDQVVAAQHPRGRGPVTDVPVWGPSFSPDGSRVAAAWGDAVRIIDVETGDVVSRVAAASPSGTAFSADGSRVAIGNFDEPAISVVDAATGRRQFTVVGDDSNGVMDLAWSPDGQWLAAAGGASARIWDGETGEYRFTIPGHASLIWELAWSRDSSRLATASDDGTALVSEITQDGPRRLFSFSAQDPSHGGGFSGVAFSPDADRLMTGYAAITGVRVWDTSLTGGGEWLNVRGPADFTPDGGLLVGRHRAEQSVLDIETGNRRAPIQLRNAGEKVYAYWLDLTPDGRLLATAEWGGVVVWDAVTGERRFAVDVGRRLSVWNLIWSPDSTRLAVVLGAERGGGHVRVVDRSGHELARLDAPPQQNPMDLSFNPDGSLLATTRIGTNVIDPTNMPVTVWDVDRGEVATTIETSAELVEFDPTGERIVTTRIVEGVAEVWDVETGRRLTTMAAAAKFLDVVFTPDGRTIASGHGDGSVRLWDPTTGGQRLVLRGDDNEISTVSFNRDGSHLASMNNEGLVRVWALDLDDLMALGEDRLTRTFTDGECRRYLHVEQCPADVAAVASAP